MAGGPPDMPSYAAKDEPPTWNTHEVPQMDDVSVTVRTYMRAWEARDLHALKASVTPDAIMTFPGGIEYHDVEECVLDRGRRFQSIRKQIEWMDVSQDDDSAVVYMCGYLNGVALDGRPITKVRFVDRFVVRGGLIARQDVWNDLTH